MIILREVRLMNDFVFWNPVKVYFGKDQVEHLSDEIKYHGKSVLLVYGGGSIKKSGVYDKVTAQLRGAGIKYVDFSGIEPNPRIGSVRKGAMICREHGLDVVLAVGGGSTIDAAKWIAAAAVSDHDPWDHIANGVELKAALPIISVLTLAATGSEMDMIGVINNPETHDKIGGHSPLIFPKASFLDPTYTYSVGAYQTACGSADIMSHVMETYFCADQTLYVTDSFMEGLMRSVVLFAPKAIETPDDYEARANLMWASSWAINGFIRAPMPQVWSCHPMEHQLSAVFDVTHGLGLAVLTPRWLEYCLDERTAPRISRFGSAVFGIDQFGSPVECAKRSIDALSNFLFCRLGIPDTLTKAGVDESAFEEMAKKACRKGPIKGFKTLNVEDVIKIYKMCM